jgi:putrescine aminotransferase
LKKTMLSTAALQELDRHHHIHPFTDSRQLHETGTRVIARGEGIYVWDNDGHRLLDGMSGLWCVNVGYGRPELIEAAESQMQQLAYYNSFFNSSTPATIELSAFLANIAPPGLNHVFFNNSGSEANETAMKAARFYWSLRGKPSKTLFLAREYGYHGVTMATASLSGLTDMHPQAGLPLANLVERVDGAYWYREANGLSPEAYSERLIERLERRIVEIGADHVAAFIGEPIYGAGGVMTPPPGYWTEVRRLCRKYDILLIADEVVCGFGRTGYWFGSERYGIEPDIMTTAKGLTSGYLPMSATILHDDIAELIIARGGEWVHGFTYSGHPVCAAVALRNLQIIRDDGLIDSVRNRIGPYFQDRLGELRDHPLVGEVRGAGMVAALELVRDKPAHGLYPEEAKVAVRVREACFRNGLIIRAARNCMMMAPPLVMTETEADEMIATIREALDEVLADLPRALAVAS